MVPPYSHGISRAPWYSGSRPLRTVFAYGALTLFRWPSQTILLTVLSLDVCPNPKDIATFGLASSAFARHY